MKRIAGENGECWIAERNLAKQCGLSRDRLRKSIKYLLEHKWIKFLWKKQSNKFDSEGTKVYKICDLWKINLSYYEDKKACLPEIHTSEKACLPDDKGVSAEGQKACLSGIPKEEHVEEEHIKKSKAIASPIHSLRAYFTERCKALYGFEPEMNFAKEGKLLKEKLKRFSEEQIKDLIDKFLCSKIGKDLGYTFSICLSAGTINQWQSGALEIKKKPYYRNDPIVEKNGKKYVIQDGQWLEFAGKKEDIIWR
jgi:hypothetical protein